ncbi:MAG TPA: acyl-CoA thioesterase [Caldilineae bacterium]|nr:acyl-CoA thioesterase [Caldilineae bacterium]
MPHPKPKGRINETTLRVRYAETDAMGIVHHSRYIPWFEVGRVNFLREIGLPYKQIEEMGFLFVITELGARYHNPARFDDAVIIRTWLEKVHSRGMRLDYQIIDEAGETLVTGFTKLICTNRQGQPTRLPADLVRLLTNES